MAWDIAINLQTGDLVWTGVTDFGSRDGSALDQQRIHVRLFIERGEFVYDPEGGALGSRLLDILRLPRARALLEADLYVREALEPMDDIQVTKVEVLEVEEDARMVRLNISYQPRFDDSDATSPPETLQETFSIDVPA